MSNESNRLATFPIICLSNQDFLNLFKPLASILDYFMNIYKLRSLIHLFDQH